MDLGYLDLYLLGINILGFILYIVNTLLYTYTPKGQIDKILTITSLLGGSLGIVIAIFFFDRKPMKEVMMSRVFVACVLVIQIIIVLLLKGISFQYITTIAASFFTSHLIAAIYILSINIITFISFAIDKYNAIKRRSRIKIITLLGMAFIGGSIGGFIAMYLFRHKTRKDYFTVGIPLIMLMQLIVIAYVSGII